MKDFIKKLTFDNDKAFARHQRIAWQLQADTYFMQLYTSQDKGTVENRMGVIRRFFSEAQIFETSLTNRSNRVKNI